MVTYFVLKLEVIAFNSLNVFIKVPDSDIGQKLLTFYKWVGTFSWNIR